MLNKQASEAAIERTNRFWYDTFQEMRLACRVAIANLFQLYESEYISKTVNLKLKIPSLELKERFATYQSGLAQL